MIGSDTSKDQWKDQYLKICEKTISNPVKDCITGALVSHLSTNLSPVIVKSESSTEVLGETFKQLQKDMLIHQQSSLNNKLRRKKVIRTSKYQQSEEIINKRRQSYNAGLEKENLEKLRLEYDKAIINKLTEEENIYEEVSYCDVTEDQDSDIYEEVSYCDVTEDQDSDIYEEVSYCDVTEDQDSELYVVPLNTFQRTSNYLAEHSKTWPRQIACPKINSSSSLPGSSLDENKLYVSFDSDVKNLIKKLLVSIQQETMDEDSLMYLEELKQYTEGTLNTEKKRTLINGKFCLQRQSKVVEEESIAEDLIYVEMVGLDSSSIESKNADELFYSVPRFMSKPTRNTVMARNSGNLNTPELLGKKLSNTPVYAVPKFADQFYTSETDEFSI